VSPTRREVIKTMVAVGALPEAVGASRAGASQSVSAIALPTPRAKALMDAFGLKYPIFQAPHGNQTSPELCIAVANAGAMGSLAAFIFDSEETARSAVSKVRSATKGNFFVNFVLQFGAKELQATLDAGAPTIEFSWGVPTKAMVAAVRAAKAKLGIQVVNAESARVALDFGADFLVCQGTEAGGHVEASRGLYETLSIVLTEAGGTPVIAAGGIGNGEGIYKVLAAGASAAALGTRFVATAESTAHPDYKRALVAADAKDTALTICFQDNWPVIHRVLRNRTFTMWETAGCSLPGKRPGEGDIVATQADGTKVVRYEGTAPRPGFVGTLADMPMWAGTSVEHIKDLPAAGELVGRLWRECEAARSNAKSAPTQDCLRS
jgi:nitronate monooxygenase